MNKLQSKIIEKCYNNIKIKSKNDSAVLGYCVKIAMSLPINEDGTISYCGFFVHNNSEQWQAEREIDEAIKEVVKEVENENL